MELDKESIQNSSQHSVPVSTEPDSVSEVSSNSSGNLTKYDEAEEKLKVLLNSLKSVSAKEDLIKSLR